MVYMKLIILSSILIIFTIGMVTIPDAFAETLYYYVEPLPDYASHANNVMNLSTSAWEIANDDLQFIEVGTWEQADFRVSWVKEFGVEHVGYAFGSWYIEVGLGDSNCSSNFGMWQPYSERHVTNIMTHEIGHILGLEHVDDPNDIMYPTAINWEYGNIETSETLTKDYGYFLPICTSKNITTFDWHVSSNDSTYGFDVYFVPSIEEFDNWVEGESFSYFDGEGCFAENMISVGGTCEGVTQDSGLLVIMGDKTTEPLTEITLNVQENYLGDNFSSDSNESVKSIPLPNPTDPIKIDSTFALYVDPQQEFSIKYPSSWIVDSEDYGVQKVGFVNDYDWTAQIYVIDYGDVDYSGFSESKILDEIVSYEQEYCDDASIIDTGYICNDFQLVVSERILMPSGEETYTIGYTDTRQYDSISGIEYPITTILTEIHDGSNVWVVYAEVDTYAWESYGDVLFESLGSFKIIQSGEGSSTTKSTPIPIPTPQPDVITSRGTAALNKTTVEIGFNQSEQVKVYGIISNVDKVTRVNITYTYPDRSTNGVQVFTTESGVYEAVLNLDSNSPEGVYEILVTSKGQVIKILELSVTDKKMESHPFAEVATTESEPTQEHERILSIASFVDETKDPQYYIDRYDNEESYKEWFDENFPQYDSIYQAVGLDTPTNIEHIPEPTVEPEPVMQAEPVMEAEPELTCGTGTELINGICQVIQTKEPEPTSNSESKGGGCLIATATYGSEMASEVQQLRELRDNSLLHTQSGTAFMTGFNQFYYSFSPIIADYERENPLFKEAVKLAITPMITSLSILNYVDMNSEAEVLGYGISLILLNLGMYLGVPAVVMVGIRKRF